jgi:hypothetical protein
LLPFTPGEVVGGQIGVVAVWRSQAGKERLDIGLQRPECMMPAMKRTSATCQG